MENILENRLSMFQKTDGYLELHLGELGSVPAILPLRIEFGNRIVKILDLASEADADITGYAREKQAKRNFLKTSILKLSTTVVAYSSINNDFATVEKCDETPSALDNMRDNDFYTYSKLVLNIAKPLMPQLADYGAIPEDWDKANTDAEKFLDVIQKPRVQISERSKTKDDLENLMDKTNDFLKNKVDKVMAVFQVTAPSLYTGYLAARSIDDTGVKTPADYEGTAVANAITKAVEIPYVGSRKFGVENTGTVPLLFSLSASSDMAGKLVSVESKGYATRQSNRLNTDSNAKFLLIQNNDPTTAGSYKIWLLD